jgi:hypothetical protein
MLRVSHLRGEGGCILDTELAALPRTADSGTGNRSSCAAGAVVAVADEGAVDAAAAAAEGDVAAKVGVLAPAVSVFCGALSPKMNCLTTFSISRGSFGRLRVLSAASWSW